MTKLVLRNFQSPGDTLMLTAAVRDLHLCHPGQYCTDVRTASPLLWENNPYITALDENDHGVEVFECQYPLVHRSNQSPFHFIWGFMDYFNQRLSTRIQPTACHADIHLSDRERAMPSLTSQLTGHDIPYWIVVAGGKYDFTIKWWHYERFQAVIDHFRGRIQFVQVGEAGHYHPALSGVIDLRGQTDLRQLILLTHHAQGVLCPVTCAMHLSAGVPVRADRPSARPCVVVAGGREPPQWEAYPTHQFIHTVGSLHCCARGGCWRARTVPLGDNDEKDKSLCLDVIDGLPRCMDLITAAEVCRRIELYFCDGSARYLTRRETAALRPHIRPSQRELLLGSLYPRK